MTSDDMALTTDGPHGYSSFYRDIASFPELGRFRRFGMFWAKKVHDDTCELRSCLTALNEQLGSLPELGVKTVLDCSKSAIMERCPRDKRDSLRGAWTAYENALVQYGETLCLSAQVMNLPTQNAFSAKQLTEWTRPNSRAIFENDEFVPTGENAKPYRDDPDKTDTCVWRNIPRGDVLTKCFLYASPWIERYILSRWRSIVHGQKSSGPQGPSSVPFDHIIGVMDLFSCLFASILLAITIATLAFVHHLGLRIVIIGIFGTLFALLLWLMSGKPKRGEVFGATAGFYAVAAVFVGSTNNGYACS